MLLPGLVLTGGLHPFLVAGGIQSKLVRFLPLGSQELVVVEVMTFGLLAYALTIHVYHIVHGARAPWLTSLSNRYTRHKVRTQAVRLKELYGNNDYYSLGLRTKRKVASIYNYLHDFSLEVAKGGTPQYRVDSRTRLGCIIDGYTSYPETRYGVDGSFYWERINYLFPAEVRKGLDSVEAEAQGMVLSAAACWLTSALSISAIVLSGVAGLLPIWIPRMTVPIYTDLAFLLVASAAGLLLFNLLAREAHRDFGRKFTAAFDVWSAEIRSWIDNQAIPFPPETIDAGAEFALVSKHLQSKSEVLPEGH